MKHYIFSLITLLFLFGCKKTDVQDSVADQVRKNYVDKIQACVKNTLPEKDYLSLDFSVNTICATGSDLYTQIGFRGKNAQKDFLLLKTDSLGNCIDARFIHLEKDPSTPHIFNGKIFVQALDHQVLISSNITNGFINALHPREYGAVTVNGQTRPDILPSVSQTLPEVVVVGSASQTGSVSRFYDYMAFQAVFNNGTGSTPSNTLSGFYGQIGGGIVGAPSSLPKILNVKYETSVSKPGIDVNAFLKCFSNIPDAGADCTISIFTDLPVDNDPSIFFNWYAGATGHVFLQLTKSSGDMAGVSQVIGFTCQKPMQAMFGPGAVASKIVDNGGHKYNGCLTMHISALQLQAAINEIKFLAGVMQYDIAKYNCVDFALQVINTIRGVNPLIIPKFQIPGQEFSQSNTPQGLFKLFSQMKAAGGPEAKNILTGAVLSAGASKGPCN